VPPLARIRAGALLAVLVAVSACLRFLDARALATPWITPDETLYGMLGRSLWLDGRLRVVGDPVGFYTLLHPLLIGLPLALWEGVAGYRVAQAVTAAAMSSAAIPVFLWGRTLMREGWALVAAALTLALPALALSGLLMTETLFYPVAAWAAWALAAALERPTPPRQAVLVAAIAAACLTRLQGIVLGPVLVAAAIGFALLVRSPRAALRLWPAAAALGGVALAWAAWRLRDGGGLARLLGGYQSVGESSYPLVRTAEEVVWHLGGVVWVAGVAPAIALVVLLALARREPPPPREAALLATAACLALGLAVQVGIFASAWVAHLAERDLIAAAPPLFLALCLWLDRGAPRPLRATALAAFGVAGLVVLVPFDRWTNAEALVDAPSLALLHQHEAPAAAWIGAAALAALLVVLPRRLLAVVPVLLAAVFALGSEAAADGRNAASQRLLVELVGPDRTWVDEHADGPVAYLYDGEANWNAAWLHAFWNRRIDEVVTLPRTVVPGPMPQTPVEIQADGAAVPAPRAAFAVLPSNTEAAGEPVAEAPQQGTAQRALVLWRLEGPLRLRSRLSGVQANGDVYGSGRLTVWDCRTGRLVVTLLGKSGEPIDVLQDERVERRAEVAPERGETVEVDARPPTPGGVCIFDVRSDGIFGTTQFRFEREAAPD
jgi:hypothetical protein